MVASISAVQMGGVHMEFRSAAETRECGYPSAQVLDDDQVFVVCYAAETVGLWNIHAVGRDTVGAHCAGILIDPADLPS